MIERERCPTCLQPMPCASGRYVFVRMCYLCESPIAKGHKYIVIRIDGASFLRHRHCDEPDAYVHNGENRQFPWKPDDAEALATIKVDA